MRDCTGCGEERHDVEERYSFGVYAGKLCLPCCSKYRDNCGEEREDGTGGGQGDPTELDENYYEDQ